MVGVEALVRWRHPTRGLVEPDAFIALAEESGSILPLGRYVLETAAAEVQHWDRTDIFLSVNVSAVRLQQPDFLGEVEHAPSGRACGRRGWCWRSPSRPCSATRRPPSTS